MIRKARIFQSIRFVILLFALSADISSAQVNSGDPQIGGREGGVSGGSGITLEMLPRSKQEVAIAYRASGFAVPEEVAIAHFMADPPRGLLRELEGDELTLLNSAIAENQRTGLMAAEMSSLCQLLDTPVRAAAVLTELEQKQHAQAVTIYRSLLRKVSAETAGLIESYKEGTHRNIAYVQIDWEGEAARNPEEFRAGYAAGCNKR